MAHIPALRRGSNYQSLDKVDVLNHRTGEKLIEVSQVNAGIVRRDLPKFAESRALLRQIPPSSNSEQVVEHILSTIYDFIEGQEPQDDITVVVVKSVES